MTPQEFCALWALEFGREWVKWLDAMQFKEKLVGKHDIQLTHLIESGLLKKKNRSLKPSYVRLSTFTKEFI
jgi:hypothetical protein